MTAMLDKRLNPVRPDLAAARLKGVVEAPRFVEGIEREVHWPLAPLRREPRPDAALDTELLIGDRVVVYDEEEGFAWVESLSDPYVGYVPAAALGTPATQPSHRVGVLRTFLYPGPSMKLPPAGHLSLGARLTVQRIEGEFAVTPHGHVWASHLVPVDHRVADPVAVAESLIGTPYLWGGRSTLGLDCSALVQLSLMCAGIVAPRDSDMQERMLGTALPLADGMPDLQRGDLVFWRGHVGFMADARTLIHANGHHMAVVAEPLDGTFARIRAKGAGEVTSIRRLVV